jgi:DeoR family transcriptional regulator, fructose operon transcriptional repressor
VCVRVPAASAGGDVRLAWLTEQLAVNGAVTLADAAAALAVSEMTIRRDLVELEERGLARRVRGGAKAVGPQPFAQRRDRMARAKSRVAAKLTDLVPATGAIALDASSTVMRLASALISARDLLVLTNGPDTFAALQQQAGVTPMLTGGRLDARTGSLVGPLACRAADVLTVRRFFVSAAAVDADTGGFEETLEEAEVKRALATAADEVVLAVDSSKLGSRALAAGREHTSRRREPGRRSFCS